MKEGRETLGLTAAALKAALRAAAAHQEELKAALPSVLCCASGCVPKLGLMHKAGFAALSDGEKAPAAGPEVFYSERLGGAPLIIYLSVKSGLLTDLLHAGCSAELTARILAALSFICCRPGSALTAFPLWSTLRYLPSYDKNWPQLLLCLGGRPELTARFFSLRQERTLLDEAVCVSAVCHLSVHPLSDCVLVRQYLSRGSLQPLKVELDEFSRLSPLDAVKRVQYCCEHTWGVVDEADPKLLEACMREGLKVLLVSPAAELNLLPAAFWHIPRFQVNQLLRRTAPGCFAAKPLRRLSAGSLALALLPTVRLRLRHELIAACRVLSRVNAKSADAKALLRLSPQRDLAGSKGLDVKGLRRELKLCGSVQLAASAAISAREALGMVLHLMMLKESLGAFAQECVQLLPSASDHAELLTALRGRLFLAQCAQMLDLAWQQDRPESAGTLSAVLSTLENWECRQGRELKGFECVLDSALVKLLRRCRLEDLPEVMRYFAGLCAGAERLILRRSSVRFKTGVLGGKGDGRLF